MHPRALIRSAVVDALSGLSVPVQASRATPLAAHEVPGCLVYARIDTPTYDLASAGDPRPVPRDVTVSIEACARSDDDVDAIAEEVETAIYADPDLAALLEDLRTGTTTLSADGDADDLLVVAQMTFTATYREALA